MLNDMGQAWLKLAGQACMVCMCPDRRDGANSLMPLFAL